MNGAIDFTIEYLTIIQSSLRIAFTEDGPAFFPDLIGDDELDDLNVRLHNLWKDSQRAIESFRDEKDGSLESCSYGFSDDFDLSLKTGYMLGQRVVYWDLLYRKLKRNRSAIDKEYLGFIATNLISALYLAKQGFFIVLPHPLEWSDSARRAYARFAEILSPYNKALPMIPSVVASFDLNLQPYTILDNEDDYYRISKETITLFSDYRELKDETYRDGIITGLTASRILKEDDLVRIPEVPINDFHKIVSSQSGFYKELKHELTSGGELMFEHNQRELLNKIRDVYRKHNLVGGNTGAHIGVGAGVLGIISVFNPKLALVSAAMTLIGALLSYSKASSKNENVVSAVFCKLSKLIE
jgi:hypothetical protein